jgi:predicted  nucleic acid-binding Zn-ribbon protein
MKTILLLSSLIISGCACCGSDTVQYVKSDSTVTVTDRYVHIPEILVDGATAELTQENDSLLTFSDVFTDSTTGKKIEISGVIPKKKDKIHFTARVPKDSVKVQDTSKTVTLKPIPTNLAWWEKIPRYVIAIIVGLIILLIVYGIVRKK